MPQPIEFYTINVSGNNTTELVDVNALLSSLSSHASAQTALQETLSSAGINLITTSSLNETSSTIFSTDTTASQTETSQSDSTADSSSSPDVEVIVPAVVVPVVTISVGLAIAAFFFMRWRKKRRIALEQEGAMETDYEGKAELHADSFRAELGGVMMERELSGPLRQDQIAELPAREPVGNGMDADNLRDSDARMRRDTS
ncbi:hypothetical protein BDV06DRAFT_225729 [Aspergillus oleicola]